MPTRSLTTDSGHDNTLRWLNLRGSTMRKATTSSAPTLKAVPPNHADEYSGNSQATRPNQSVTEPRDKVLRHLTAVPPLTEIDATPRPRRMRPAIALLLAAGHTLPPA